MGLTAAPLAFVQDAGKIGKHFARTGTHLENAHALARRAEQTSHAGAANLYAANSRRAMEAGLRSATRAGETQVNWLRVGESLESSSTKALKEFGELYARVEMKGIRALTQHGPGLNPSQREITQSALETAAASWTGFSKLPFVRS